MAEIPDAKQADAVVVQLASSLEMPSVPSTAESMLLEAIDYCAQKMGVSSRSKVIDLLVQRDRNACEYCLYGVARQVAASLGTMDDNVRTVYTLDYDATPEDLCFGQGTQTTRLIHLLVWTKRKTAALDSLAAALDRALVQAFSELIGVRGMTTLLDIQIVDDADVRQRRGYGMFRAWMHNQPIRIWKR